MAKRVTEKILIERMKKIKTVEYISGYTKINSKANFKCLKCGKIWEVIPKDIIRKHTKECPE